MLLQLLSWVLRQEAHPEQEAEMEEGGQRRFLDQAQIHNPTVHVTAMFSTVEQ